MNFKYMPELDWFYGYVLSLLLMIVSGIVPYFWFKRRGWL
jgi:magnesium transporter